MSVTHHKVGPTTIAKVADGDGLRRVLDDPWLRSDTIVIKPNWVSTEPADFTDVEALKVLFEALDSQFVVTESYCLNRSMNLLDEGMSFTVDGKDVNWKWLLKGDGWKWLRENPDWQWFKDDGHWEQMRAEEKEFLDRYGFSDLFREYDVTYLNVTEEVWNNRIADPIKVKEAVESRFKPLQAPALHDMVPEKLYDLRGSTFISFAKLKAYASFTLKNLFGMISDPHRPWWHGPKNCRIAQSIVDINKIYHALFNVFGICEGIYKTGYSHPEGEFEGIYTGKYKVADNFGVVAFGRDLVSLDAALLALTDPAIRRIAEESNRTSIKLAAEELGAYDEVALERAKKEIGDWLSP